MIDKQLIQLFPYLKLSSPCLASASAEVFFINLRRKTSPFTMRIKVRTEKRFLSMIVLYEKEANEAKIFLFHSKFLFSIR